VEDPALRLRQSVGGFVLIVVTCWVFASIAFVIGLVSGGVPLIRWLSVVVPGFALVPAAYLSVKLRLAKDADEIKALWPKSALYGGIGLALFISTVVVLVQVQEGSG